MLALVACREHPTVPAAAPHIAQLGAPNDVLGTFTTIDVPGATSTFAAGINSQGDIVGAFDDANGVRHGFLRTRNGDFATIDYPRVGLTFAQGINSEGDIVGNYRDAYPKRPKSHGFLLRGGEFTTVDPPVDACFTRAADINSAGDIVGQYNTPLAPAPPCGTGPHDGKQHGFLLREGRFTTLDFPDPTVNVTQVWAINLQGDMVGRADGGACCRGFLKREDAWKFIDFPGDNVWYSEVRGINAGGEILGVYSNGPPNQYEDGFHGFVMTREGAFTSFDFPGAYGTHPSKINARGDVVGWYWTATAGPKHGFLLTRAR
jgi:probable HAF family extracellular repeat protein